MEGEQTTAPEAVDTSVETEAPVVEAEEAPETPEATEAPAQEQKDDDFSARFAALSRREAELVERERAIKEAQSFQRKEGESALEWLARNNIQMDDILAETYGVEKPEPTAEEKIATLQSQIEEMKAQKEREREEAEKAAQMADQNRINEAIENHKKSIISFTTEKADHYELINALNQQEMVWDVTEAHYNKTGEVLTIEQASNLVEAELEKAYVDKFSKLNKFKKVFEPKVPEKSEEPLWTTEPVEQPKRQSVTLTSDLVPQTSPKQERLSVEESKKRAAALLEWT